MKSLILKFFRKVTKVLLWDIDSKLTAMRGNLHELNASSKRVYPLLEEMHILELKKSILNEYPESLIRYGYSTFSQNDEDGIIEEIFRRIDIKNPNFIEFGVAENENNSLNLLLKGSKGVWIDKGLSGFKSRLRNEKLNIIDSFVTLENILDIVNRSSSFLGVNKTEIDMISLDLDGNDYYFIERIVQDRILPKLFCLEYNGKFKNTAAKINYNESHTWSGDDYFGCSLQSYLELLIDNYTLITCNITGANCFFIRNDFKDKFTIYEPNQLHQPPRYYLSPLNKGHRSSTKYINS